MKYNPDEFNELPLSDYEKGYLTAFYEGYFDMQEYQCHNSAWYEHLLENDDKEWVGVAIGDRVFDLCIYFDMEKIERRSEPDPEYTEDLIVLVYECHPEIDGMGNPTGNYTTDTSLEYYLKEA